MKHKYVVFIVLTLLVLNLPGCDKKSSGIIKLKMGHALDVGHPVHKALVYMQERLKEKSGGKILLEIYPGEQLGSESELVKQLQMGALDMTKVSTSPLESFIPIYCIFSQPYLFRSEAHFWNVLEGPIGKRLLLAGESKKLRGLCYYDAGSRSFYTKDKMISSPDDLKGMKIRVLASNTAMQMMKMLGASSVSISWGELYTSLQQGVVDGAENNPPSFYRSSHFEVCKYYSLDEHTMVPDIVLIGTKTWKRLSPEVQQMVQEAADESVEFQKKIWKEDSDYALKMVQEKGVKIYNPDKAPFREKVKAMFESYTGTEVGELIREIEQVQ
ncbi:MAG: TRAP transporter substrate-binding protein [Sedimentisphaerales bacterium]|nr:TRAP transporter substrate-binding protein [Sedimentisphaerales bacterium]